jgi:glycerol-3-phosphate dehydrogenase
LKEFNIGAFKQFKFQIKERNKFYQMVPHLFIGRKVAIPSYSKMERFKNSIFTHLYSILSGKDEIFDQFSFFFSYFSGFLNKPFSEASYIFLKSKNLQGTHYYYEAQTNECRLNTRLIGDCDLTRLV